MKKEAGITRPLLLDLSFPEFRTETKTRLGKSGRDRSWVEPPNDPLNLDFVAACFKRRNPCSFPFRLPSLRAIMASAKKPQHRLELAALGLEAEALTRKTEVIASQGYKRCARILSLTKAAAVKNWRRC
jgi:hypothetical protein